MFRSVLFCSSSVVAPSLAWVCCLKVSCVWLKKAPRTSGSTCCCLDAPSTYWGPKDSFNPFLEHYWYKFSDFYVDWLCRQHKIWCKTRNVGNQINEHWLQSAHVNEITSTLPQSWMQLFLFSSRPCRDQARYNFTHEILKDEESIFNGQRVPRSRRISVICRNLPAWIGS